MSQPFRAYSSVQQGVNDYVTLLQAHPALSGRHWARGDDVHAFGSALARGGYATDPGYVQKLQATAASVKALRVRRRSCTVTQDSGRPADNCTWGILVSEGRSNG